MKRLIVIGSIAIGLVMLTGVVALAWKEFTDINPYLIRPRTVSLASEGASIGHSVVGNSRTLSIVSSNDVVVVADPGVSFQYEVVWLVERPRKDGMHTLREYRYELPQYAAADHINPMGSQIPPKIQQVADGGHW